MLLNVTPGTGKTPVLHCSIQVIAIRDDRFVEFEFVLGDPDLRVELVLEGSQFTEFCRAQRITRVEAAAEAHPGWERLQRRLGLFIPTAAPGAVLPS
jgi:phenol hydroxylase P0 protein